MNFEIKKTTENFDPNTLISIWKESLPELDERRIEWSYKNNPLGTAHLWLIYEKNQDE